jgi:hypothetical protein
MEIEKVFINVKFTLEEAVILKSLLDSIAGTGNTRNIVNHMSDMLEIEGLPVNRDVFDDLFKGELTAVDPKMGE